MLQSGRDAGVKEKMERSDLLQQESNLRLRERGFGTFVLRLEQRVFNTPQSTLPLSGVCVCLCVDKRVWWEVSASCASAGRGVITVSSETQTRPAHLCSPQMKIFFQRKPAEATSKRRKR